MNLCTKQTAAKFLAQKHDFDYWLFLATNALLRCEQRNAEATANHLNHLNYRIVKMPRVANHS
jgi:hypothetical protein